ncbi:MAG: hypothetical protein A2V78_02490 [Betaproteobacteria bacterium RBG_16_64_18]|nr:MAG: hypothetical protein A2V78_02490 [Betaproteobacteria bacterium RBG_16_64_18]
MRRCDSLRKSAPCSENSKRPQQWLRSDPATVAKWSDTATGTAAHYIPAGPKRDELLGLVRIGIKFQQQQHTGRRPGFLHRYIASITGRIKPPVTFERLLEELELEAARRNLAADDEPLPPVETVNRVWELVTYHHPKRGPLQVAFGTLRNYFTATKKDRFTGSAKP